MGSVKPTCNLSMCIFKLPFELKLLQQCPQIQQLNLYGEFNRIQNTVVILRALVISRFNPDIITCRLCGKVLATRGNLKKHLHRTHEHKEEVEEKRAT